MQANTYRIKRIAGPPSRYMEAVIVPSLKKKPLPIHNIFTPSTKRNSTKPSRPSLFMPDNCTCCMNLVVICFRRLEAARTSQNNPNVSYAADNVMIMQATPGKFQFTLLAQLEVGSLCITLTVKLTIC